MKSLLIIDDSKAILNTIEYIANYSGRLKPYTALSYKEAEELISQHSFFAAIVDLNLPDCIEGEAVKLTTSHSIPSIVLTGSINQTLRKTIKQFPIVDYIVKLDEHSIFSSVLAAEALLNFENESVLIVDPNITNGSELKQYLQRLYFNAIHVESAERALELLSQDKQFRVIITEQNLPEMNGIHFIQELRKVKFKNHPVIFGMSSSENIEVKLLFLKSGAQDFFIKPLVPEEIYPKIANILQMGEQEQRLEHYVQMINKYVITSETDLLGRITYASDAFCHISGYSKEELIGQNHNIMRHSTMPVEIYQDLWETIKRGKSWTSEIKNKKKNNDFYWVKIHIDTIYDKSGDAIGYRAIKEDITDKKYIELESLTDSMTDLYNRRYYNKYFPKLLNIGIREKKPVAMILLDVDHFKLYNDTYGHQKGDTVLAAIGSILKNVCQRGNDTPFRMGGEEFGVLSFNNDIKQIECLANKLCEAIKSLNIIHKYNSAAGVVTASFGIISTSQNDQLNMEQLYSEADKALYIAKKSGRNQVCRTEM